MANIDGNLTVNDWMGITKNLSRLCKEGIGLKCPFCGEKSISSIHSGMLQVRCGTRIVIKPNEGSTKNVVTFNAHALGVRYTVNERYPYKEFDCKV